MLKEKYRFYPEEADLHKEFCIKEEGPAGWGSVYVKTPRPIKVHDGDPFPLSSGGQSVKAKEPHSDLRSS